jgi:hypothetical protein
MSNLHVDFYPRASVSFGFIWQVQGRVWYVFTSSCRSFLGYLLLVRSSWVFKLSLFWLSSILRSVGFMVQEFDEPCKLACLDTTTLQVTWLDRKSTINRIRKALTRRARLYPIVRHVSVAFMFLLKLKSVLESLASFSLVSEGKLWHESQP